MFFCKKSCKVVGKRDFPTGPTAKFPYERQKCCWASNLDNFCKKIDKNQLQVDVIMQQKLQLCYKKMQICYNKMQTCYNKLQLRYKKLQTCYNKLQIHYNKLIMQKLHDENFVRYIKTTEHKI